MAAQKLDPTSPVPLYQQLVMALEVSITSGEVPPGSYLPGEMELSECYGVSRITAKRALDELASAGLVIRARGRGTRVVERPRSVPAAVEGSIDGWLETVGYMQRTTGVRVLDVADIPVPRSAAQALGIDVGSRVQRAIRVRTLEGTPLSYLVTYLPPDIANGIRAADLGETPLLKLLERAGHHVAEARQRIGACTAAPDVAQALEVSPGAALLEVRRTARNADGRAIQHICAFYRPDLYHIEISLARVGHAETAHWTTGHEGPR